MKALVVGAGQIGRAIHDIIRPYHEVHLRDMDDYPLAGVDVLHICYPDTPVFSTFTRGYIEQYKPSLTIIHSSVSVGTTETCGPSVVHAPVRGRHPKLASEIPAFTIFVAGLNREDVRRACEYLEGCNLVTRPVYNPKETELCKLLSNIHMGLEIAWRQEVQRMLDKYGVPVLTYKEWEESYNMGYRITGDEHFTRPIMRPDPIGGHCILQCMDILNAQHPSKVFEFIKESNEKAKRSDTVGRETVSA